LKEIGQLPPFGGAAGQKAELVFAQAPSGLENLKGKSHDVGTRQEKENKGGESQDSYELQKRRGRGGGLPIVIKKKTHIVG